MNGNETSFIKKYTARLGCTTAAVILGLLVVSVGIIKTVFIIALAAIGFFIGYLLDDKETLRRIINNYIERP
jgi:uncharacterized membrane protein